MKQIRFIVRDLTDIELSQVIKGFKDDFTEFFC